MQNEQKIRAVLFYISFLIFIIGLPLIITFALSYKFDKKTFKLTRSGIIAIKTQPAAASVYLNEKLLDAKTPLAIDELLPGNYNIKISLPNHYTFTQDVKVQAGAVTRLEKIILFPLRPDIEQINREEFDYFWVDQDKSYIYYVNLEEGNIYKSDMDGKNLEMVASVLQLNPPALEFILSPDKKKIAYFNKHEIAVTFLEPHKNYLYESTRLRLDNAKGVITNLFWRSGSYYIILITENEIDILESNLKSKPITVVNLNKKNAPCYYDLRADSLYFIDTEQATDGKTYKNLYKFDLNVKELTFKQIMRFSPSEQ